MRKFKVSIEKVSNEDKEDETVRGKNGGDEGVIVKAIIDRQAVTQDLETGGQN